MCNLHNNNNNNDTGNLLYRGHRHGEEPLEVKKKKICRLRREF